KYVTAQMDRCNPLVEEAIYAFQDTRLVRQIAEVARVRELVADADLYAGGISMMGRRQFLNPHIDNSHDHERHRWRVFNLLYYVTPGWQTDWGGNLELWPRGVSGEPLTIDSRFNRLVVMATHQDSWHSVSPVLRDDYRCCVSNYYFSPIPLRETDQFHVTMFRGRPEQRFRDWLLRADGKLRAGVRAVFRSGVVPVTHIYRR
ncbi:MAG: 2OG-Fe(II) oxygenase, partial [Gammaproteobacteria bacterium]|nr:2OG-Fe(II) oxygenase [Gammaproteobacteria bacterium]